MSPQITDETVQAKINELTDKAQRRREAFDVWKQGLAENRTTRDSARNAFAVATSRPNDVVGTEARANQAVDELENDTPVVSNVDQVTSSTGSTTALHGSHAASSDDRKSLIIAGVVGALIGIFVLIISTEWVFNSFSEAFIPLMGYLVATLYVIVAFSACILVALYVVDRRNPAVAESTPPTIVESSETTRTDGARKFLDPNDRP